MANVGPALVAYLLSFLCLVFWCFGILIVCIFGFAVENVFLRNQKQIPKKNKPKYRKQQKTKYQKTKYQK